MYRGGGWVIVMVNILGKRPSIPRKIILKETNQKSKDVLTMTILYVYTITLIFSKLLN